MSTDTEIRDLITAEASAPTAGVGSMMMMSLEIARRHQRELKKVEAAIMAEMNAEGGDAIRWKYSLPFKEVERDEDGNVVKKNGKPVFATRYAEDISIRAAEAIQRCWGFLLVESSIVEDRGDYITVSAKGFDAVAGNYISRQRRVKTTQWSREEARAIQVKDHKLERDIDSAMAKCRRDVIKCFCPAYIIQKIFNRAVELMSKEIDVKGTLAAFSALGVIKAQLEALLGHELESVSKEERVRLVEIYQALRDGETTVAEVFGKSAPASDRPPLDARIDPVVAGKIYAEIGREKADALTDAELAPYLDKYKVSAEEKPAENPEPSESGNQTGAPASPAPDPTPAGRKPY